MRYMVMRGIQRDGKWRFEAGDEVEGRQIPGAPVKDWLKSGVLAEIVEDDDGPDVED